MQDFVIGGKFQFVDLLLFYSYQFIKRSSLLLPLALLVASIKVLCSFNATRELVALQAAGIKLKTLLRPFFILAFVCCSFNWACAEKLLPHSLNSLITFDDTHYYAKRDRKEPFYVLYLKDHTKLIYQKHNKEQKQFFDVYWIRNLDDIWRIKTLSTDPKNPIAEHADHLLRQNDGTLYKAESYEKCRLNGLKWDGHLSRKGSIPIENRKLSQLFKVLFHTSEISKKQASEVLTYFSFRIVMPILSFLVVLAIAPFCIRYSRTIPVFFIYAGGLFGYIAFFTLMDACVILGKNHTLHPLVALLVPFGLCSGFFSLKFIKNC
jgi:lipopolysaccharide export system permease protein